MNRMVCGRGTDAPPNLTVFFKLSTPQCRLPGFKSEYLEGWDLTSGDVKLGRTVGFVLIFF